MTLKTFDLTREMLDHAFPDVVAPDKARLLSCIQCGSCTASCPTAYAMDYTPRQLWRLIQVGLREEVLLSNSFWLCTACYACNTRCPRGIPTMETMLELKVLAARERDMMPLSLQERCQAVEQTHNVAGESNELRLSWTQNLPEGEDWTRPRPAEVVYFVGCYACFFPLTYGVAQATAQLLRRLGVSFTTLGTAEWCCGYPLLVAGRQQEAAAQALHNLEQIERTGATRLVTACAHCYHVWHTIYPQFLPGRAMPQVQHISTFLQDEFSRQGWNHLSPVEAVVTFHDPCDLGRKEGIYDPPRALLGLIPDLRVVEMTNWGENATCCGGGGDLPWMREDVASELGRRRLGQAVASYAGAIVTACQLCRHTLSKTALRQGARIQVLDLVELLWSAVAEEPLDIPEARTPIPRTHRIHGARAEERP